MKKTNEKNGEKKRKKKEKRKKGSPSLLSAIARVTVKVFQSVHGLKCFTRLGCWRSLVVTSHRRDNTHLLEKNTIMGILLSGGSTLQPWRLLVALCVRRTVQGTRRRSGQTTCLRQQLKVGSNMQVTVWKATWSQPTVHRTRCLKNA